MQRFVLQRFHGLVRPVTVLRFGQQVVQGPFGQVRRSVDPRRPADRGERDTRSGLFDGGLWDTHRREHHSRSHLSGGLAARMFLMLQLLLLLDKVLQAGVMQ